MAGNCESLQTSRQPKEIRATIKSALVSRVNPLAVSRNAGFPHVSGTLTKTLIAYETLPDGAYWCGRCMRWRSVKKAFWHAIAAERISANSGLARTLAKNGSESIAG
jgi:hypothetical protein